MQTSPRGFHQRAVRNRKNDPPGGEQRAASENPSHHLRRHPRTVLRLARIIQDRWGIA